MNTEFFAQNLLSLDDPDQVLKSLQNLGICGAQESVIAIEKAGEGNMNLVLRVTTPSRSVIVKQARPWVEKYPSIAAPADRILSEIDFYERISEVSGLQVMMPSVLASDSQLRLLVLEDLGTSADYSSLYALGNNEQEVTAVFEQAIRWVADLHKMECKSVEAVGCRQLRELNHAHMFSVPLADPPALDLDSVCPGLDAASRSLRKNSVLHELIGRLGEIYLHDSVDNPNSALLHGDYYPGSWLKTNSGFRVIDPEFCFCGAKEFDIGIIAAHRVFCHANPGNETIEQLCHSYGDKLEQPIVGGFAAVELIRRLIGVAQLPLAADLSTRERWLDFAEQLLMDSSASIQRVA